MGAWLHCLSSSGRLSPNLVFAAAGAVALVLVLLTLLAFLLLGGETRLVAGLFRAFAGQRLIRRFIAGTMFDLIILFGNGAEVGVWILGVVQFFCDHVSVSGFRLAGPWHRRESPAEGFRSKDAAYALN